MTSNSLLHPAGRSLAAALLLLGVVFIANKPVYADKAERIERGEYLVGLLACTRCHTSGALTQQPNPAMFLAGSTTGIAYTGFIEGEQPGVVFPSNLTPDVETGLGDWNTPEIVRAIRAGIDKHGRQQRSIMPWPGYAYLRDEDALAIAIYLQSLKPIKHRIPRPVERGGASTNDFVRFGVYRFKAGN